jgi:23S rRNA pseudoU1915 N3-methylase RlmH
MQAIKIHEQWCKKQQEDFQTMMTAVDDLGAASLALATNGAQGYTQFIQARDNFKEMFSEMSKNYRYVE